MASSMFLLRGAALRSNARARIGRRIVSSTALSIAPRTLTASHFVTVTGSTTATSIRPAAISTGQTYDRVRDTVREALDLCNRVDDKSTYAQLLQESLQRLEGGGPFRLVVLGEINTGKSALINTLVAHLSKNSPLAGDVSLPAVESAVVETKKTHRIVYGESVAVEDAVSEDGFPERLIRHPSPFMAENGGIEFVDTAGLSTTPESVKSAVRYGDVIVFVTDTTRQLSERLESQVLKQLQHSRVVVVVGKIDRHLDSSDSTEKEAELDRIVRHVESRAKELTKDANIRTFRLSSRYARNGRSDSGVREFGEFISREFSPDARMAARLAGSVGVSRYAVDALARRVEIALTSARGTHDALTALDRQTAAYEQEMAEEFSREELEVIDRTVIAIKDNIIEHFREDLRGFKLVGQWGTEKIESLLSGAFGRDFLREVEYRMTFAMGRLSEGRDRQATLVAGELKEIAGAAQLSSTNITRGLSADILEIAERVAKHDVNTNPYAMSNKVFEADAAFDHTRQCREAASKLQRALALSSTFQVLAIGAGSGIFVLGGGALLSGGVGLSFALAGLGFLKWRRHTQLNLLLDRTNRLQKALKSELSAAFEKQMRDLIFLSLRSALAESSTKVSARIDSLSQQKIALSALSNALASLESDVLVNDPAMHRSA
eukprot:Opistho-2@75630